MNWRPRHEKPADRQQCCVWIGRGMACDVIVVGASWMEEGNLWLDFFDSPEAGASIAGGQENVLGWCPLEEMTQPAGVEEKLDITAAEVEHE